MRKLYILLIISSIMNLSACKKNNTIGDNPLLEEWNTPFGVPPFDEIKPSHYKPAFERAMEIHTEEIRAIVENPEAHDFENTILAFDKSGELLEHIYTLFELINLADKDPRMQEIEKEMSPLLTKHNDDIYLNPELYDRISEVYLRRNNLGLDSLQLKLTVKTYEKFIRAGAHLDQVGKDELRKKNEELAAAQIEFGNNLLAANRDFTMELDSIDVASLPTGIKDAALVAAQQAGLKGKYLFTLSKPSLIPFITYSERRDLRERIYKGYLNRCNYNDPNDNRQTINDIVRLRTEKAQLLGFKTHADYMLSDRMAESPEAVYELLDGLWTPALETAKQELQDMKVIQLRETGIDDFQSWDWWYYAEKVRNEKYALEEEMLRPYFSLQNVRSGIFELSNRLYGLTFRPLTNVPVYNKDCVVYEVLDIDHSHLGVLIMDFFPREGRKSGGAWCGSYRPRSYDENGNKINPIVTIVCNFTPPVGNKPSLLSLDEVTTFFHEFGHALHALMTDVPYRGLNRVERDFVELPSQIMENWALEPDMLRRYALHYSSNSVIPENLIEKIDRSRYFNQGFATVEFLAAAYSDMDIHTIEQFSYINVNEFEKQVLNERRGLIPEIEPRYRYPYFSHIFDGGYSAGYYSYLWAEVLDKDAFEAFLESGDLYNKSIADSFRKNILEKGGSLDGMTMYRNFRGRNPAKEPLLYGRGLMERPVPVLDIIPEYVPIEDGEELQIEGTDVNTSSEEQD